MSYHFLNVKLEDTLKGYIQGVGGLPCNVYTFGEIVALGEKVVEPFIGIRCVSSSPAFPEVQLGEALGNRMYQAEIAVRTHAEDITESETSTVVIKTSRNNHADLCGMVLDAFYRSDILTALNDATAAVGNIGIDQIDHPEMLTDIVDRSYVTLITFPIMCHPNQ